MPRKKPDVLFLAGNSLPGNSQIFVIFTILLITRDIAPVIKSLAGYSSAFSSSLKRIFYSPENVTPSILNEMVTP
ncbi:hypothetical protein, partial [Citrobacter farmeri]|uniref:hypothetical protein n=1 Tax=Citrobacter farmeri TaxID=67824 RepID=UPI0021ABF792